MKSLKIYISERWVGKRLMIASVIKDGSDLRFIPNFDKQHLHVVILAAIISELTEDLDIEIIHTANIKSFIAILFTHLETWKANKWIKSNGRVPKNINLWMELSYLMNESDITLSISDGLGEKYPKAVLDEFKEGFSELIEGDYIYPSYIKPESNS